MNKIIEFRDAFQAGDGMMDCNCSELVSSLTAFEVLEEPAETEVELNLELTAGSAVEIASDGSAGVQDRKSVV